MILIYQGYQIKPQPQNPKTLVIVTDGRGGKIPACLEGLYTSVGVAKQAIDQYLTIKPVRGADGRTKTVSKS